MSEIRNLKKAAACILKAIGKKEQIILYGDADLDGVSSVIILKETLKNLGGKISAVYFPDREIEGYGITENGLDYLKKFSPSLLIALDLGIGNFKEVKLAKKLGFEVMIIDHHEILDKLPQAKVVVDPKQKKDRYPFKELAAVGIVFRLSELLLENKMTENLRKSFLELTALATIADMMPKEKDNEIFIEEGLKNIERSWRPGLQAFFQIEDLDHYLNLNQKISKIISLLNVRDVEGNFPASFRLLDSSSMEESKDLIRKLIEKGKLRSQKIEKIVEAVKERLDKKELPVVFEGDSEWDFSLISSVASIICQKYQKPTFIFKKLEKESQGTVRTPQKINGVVLMKKCKKFLLTYGGHPRASGFRVKNENLEKFENCLIKNFKI